MNSIAILAIISWIAAVVAYACGKRARKAADGLMILGVALGAAVIASLWMLLERPPMRTLGETRWWYAVLTPALGIWIGWRYQTRAMAIPACLLGAAFAVTNLLHPEYLDKTLMPALQSPWFVPHVVMYMMAYAALGLSSVVAIVALVKSWATRRPAISTDVELPHRLVLVGLPLLTFGLLIGALWAKVAWGHYWTWDPKETWAFLTWSVYLIYIHAYKRHQLRPSLHLSLLGLGFVALLICWFGVNYLPSAQQSVHTYTR